MHWTSEFVLALIWLAVVLSIGSIGLLYWLIRRSAATSVASLFYLVPAVTALMAFVLFGERLDAIAIAGMIACAAAVFLVNRGARPAKAVNRAADARIGRERAFAADLVIDDRAADRSCRARRRRLRVRAASRSTADGSDLSGNCASSGTQRRT